MMHACSPFSGNRAGVKKRHVVGGGLLARACVANAGRAICCYSTKYFFLSLSFLKKKIRRGKITLRCMLLSVLMNSKCRIVSFFFLVSSS